MVMELRPKRGGFNRPFGCAWFIREYLAGRANNGAGIDPAVGAPQTDIFSAYKEASRRSRAENLVAREEEKRIKRGKPTMSVAEADEMLQALLKNMPVRSTGMSYHSFCNYFGIIKRLGWVEKTGKTEPSTFQEHYPDAPPRRFYRLTDIGREATEDQINDPIMYLYGYTREERSTK